MENEINKNWFKVRILSIITAFGLSGIISKFSSLLCVTAYFVNVTGKKNDLYQTEVASQIKGYFNIILLIALVICVIYLYFDKKNHNLLKNNSKKLLSLLKKRKNSINCFCGYRDFTICLSL